MRSEVRRKRARGRYHVASSPVKLSGRVESVTWYSNPSGRKAIDAVPSEVAGRHRDVGQCWDSPNTEYTRSTKLRRPITWRRGAGMKRKPLMISLQGPREPPGSPRPGSGPPDRRCGRRPDGTASAESEGQDLVADNSLWPTWRARVRPARAPLASLRWSAPKSAMRSVRSR